MGPNHLSVLGIIHTAFSILAILVALFALFRDGKIDPGNGSGKLYIVLTAIACLTSLPIMRFGHLAPGHYLAVLILILLPLGCYAGRIFGKAADYVQVIIMSTTLFLSLIPGVIETFTRLPMDHPLASSANDPLVKKWLLILAIVYLAGVIYQVIKLGKVKKVG
jgi:hypothetical protein